MDDPPLAGGHGLQGNAAARGRDPLGHAVGQDPQAFGPALPVALHVDFDVGPALELATQDEADQEVKGSQGLAPAPDEQAGILAIDVEGKDAFGPLNGGAGPFRKADECGDPHSAEQPLDGLLGQVHDVRRLEGPPGHVHDVRRAELHPDQGWLCAQPQDTWASLIDDDDFDVFALDRQLIEGFLDSFFDGPAGHLQSFHWLPPLLLSQG